MVGHLGHILGGVLVLAFCAWLLTLVGVWDFIQIIAVLLILFVLSCAVYYIKTEADIIKRREEDKRKREEQEKKQKGEKERQEKERQERLEKETDIALGQVKKLRDVDLYGLTEEQRKYLINEWKKQIRTYLQRGWTWEKTVEQVCKGVPPV
ncbi:MAG: hypothetical protein JW778_02535 [Candidatus Altiarchaeota archaeon]|nr:hypothetical protein [Candidatus Altiarchaeota archaeon]